LGAKKQSGRIYMIIYLTEDLYHNYLTYLFVKWLRKMKPNEKILLFSPELNNENDVVVGKLSAYFSTFLSGNFQVLRQKLERIDRLKDVYRDLRKGIDIGETDFENETIFLGSSTIVGGFLLKVRKSWEKGPKFLYADRWLQLWNDEEKYIGDLKEIEITPEELAGLLGIKFYEADEYDKKKGGIPQELLGHRWYDGIGIVDRFDKKIDIEKARYYYPTEGIVLFQMFYSVSFEEGLPVFKIFIPYNEKDKHREGFGMELLIFISAIKFLIPFIRIYIIADHRNERAGSFLDIIKYDLNIPWRYYRGSEDIYI
jgi:hypothetical protein